MKKENPIPCTLSIAYHPIKPPIEEHNFDDVPQAVEFALNRVRELWKPGYPLTWIVGSGLSPRAQIHAEGGIDATGTEWRQDPKTIYLPKNKKL